MPTQLHTDPIPHIVIENRHGQAVICLQGAQVMHYQQVGQQPLLWATDRKHWIAGKNLRGGIPICWPWFGPHETDPTLPLHGWVRQREWALKTQSELPNGATRLVFTIAPEQPLTNWPQGLEVALEVIVGATLRLRLTTRNKGDEPVRVEDALHTYFAVSDAREIRIHGIEGLPYADQFDGKKNKVETEDAVVISEPVCRVYQGDAPECAIDDHGLNRRIRISARGNASTVLWSPGEKIAATMGDLGDQWPKMVCLETANCQEGALLLEPGDAQETVAEYGVDAL